MTIKTTGCGLIEITPRVLAWVAQSGVRQGLLPLFVRHISASLLLGENADSDVRADLDRFFARPVTITSGRIPGRWFALDRRVGLRDRPIKVSIRPV